MSMFPKFVIFCNCTSGFIGECDVYTDDFISVKSVCFNSFGLFVNILKVVCICRVFLLDVVK